MYYPMYYDPTYILIIIGMLLSMIASSRVKTTYAKYNRVRNHAGVTGQMAAQQILRQAGIYDVQVQRVSGNLPTIMIQGIRCFVFRMRRMVLLQWQHLA